MYRVEGYFGLWWFGTPTHQDGRRGRFVDREVELRALRCELAPILTYGEMLGGPLVLTGPRGVGKPSLLHEVRLMAAADGYGRGTA
jgi:hypothetical protein